MPGESLPASALTGIEGPGRTRRAQRGRAPERDAVLGHVVQEGAAVHGRVERVPDRVPHVASRVRLRADLPPGARVRASASGGPAEGATADARASCDTRRPCCAPTGCCAEGGDKRRLMLRRAATVGAALH